MPKISKTYTLNSLGMMYETLDKRVSSLEKDVKQLKNDVAELKISVTKINDRLDSIDERTALIPMLYNNVDKFMKEIIDNREFRSITELRLERLELKTTHIAG